MAAETLLALWNDTPTRRAIVDFVQAVSAEGSPGFAAPAERVAVFDNDLGLLMGAVESAFEGMEVETFGAEVMEWLTTASHPMLRRLYLACGFAPMVELRLLVLHDDADREFAYTTGAEDALDRAKTHGWTVVSMKEDWSAVFASA